MAWGFVPPGAGQGGGGAAPWAGVHDPLAGKAHTFLTDITGWIIAYGVPLLVGVMAASLVVLVFVVYVKRWVRAMDADLDAEYGAGSG